MAGRTENSGPRLSNHRAGPIRYGWLSFAQDARTVADLSSADLVLHLQKTFRCQNESLMNQRVKLGCVPRIIRARVRTVRTLVQNDVSQLSEIGKEILKILCVEFVADVLVRYF